MHSLHAFDQFKKNITGLEERCYSSVINTPLVADNLFKVTIYFSLKDGVSVPGQKSGKLQIHVLN